MQYFIHLFGEGIRFWICEIPEDKMDAIQEIKDEQKCSWEHLFFDLEFLKKMGYSHWSEMAIEGEQKAFLLAANNRIEIKQKAKLVTRFMSIELEQQSTLFSLYQTVLEPLYLPESQSNRFVLTQLETGLFGSYTFEATSFDLEKLEFQLSPHLYLEDKHFMTGISYKDHEITLKKEDTLVREMRVFKL